ncbi:vanadium-dependent haloperoxidase [Actinoplanes sp. DH11]|uniref:vanadium-dependent haloperoxidase n=1 Tax=Actinoplanes sp. DH11 TaxID=2857011 RepID=UPI001E4094F4|nr:vanadium-dependent haloperoxidase [Actinoplanes sp. DH11]
MNAVLDWNETFLQAVRVRGGAPGPIARAGAILHIAVHDAIMAITPTHAPYLAGLDAAGTENKEAAVHRAAHRVLSALFPEQSATFDAQLAQREGALPAPGAKRRAVLAGRRIGTSAALAILADRSADRHDDATPYRPGTAPGAWRPANPAIEPVTPNWGRVRPFSLRGGPLESWLATFRPPLPAGAADVASLLTSQEYAAQVNEVKELGRFDSVTRTAEQTEIAHFWANDLDGTYKPPGQLFTMSRVLATDEGLDLAATARLFALVAIVMADAAVVAWDAKYATELDLWRPDTAIRLAALVDNPGVAADPLWQPLSIDYGGARFSPPFPAYVSGHATFGAAHARMMANYFGTDDKTFELSTDDPFAAGVKRGFTTFSGAGKENGRSRIYLGVHYSWDADEAQPVAYRLADHVFATLLTES